MVALFSVEISGGFGVGGVAEAAVDAGAGGITAVALSLPLSTSAGFFFPGPIGDSKGSLGPWCVI